MPETGVEKQLESWFSSPTLEMLPNSTSMGALQAIPLETHHSITNLQSENIDTTTDFSLGLVGEGRSVIPHISASRIDRQKAFEVGNLLKRCSVDHIFVMNGDNDGDTATYASSLELLEDLRDNGITFGEIGVVGHPEGHPQVPGHILDQALVDKQDFAKQTEAEMYIVTQMCFDPSTVASWIRQIRSKGVNLPAKIGVPGPIGIDKLINYSGACGVGESVQFLKTGSEMSARGRSNARSLFNPYNFLNELAQETTDSDGIDGLYFFTFNEPLGTQEWFRNARETV
ncbi:MAG TPA: methylenetetrahydrofolate reductase [Candidatus Saccharimonadales bacterium]|nr:methylenetetrahydrofolate reductase [Candidatus Saccharimonadales bacterium]